MRRLFWLSVLVAAYFWVMTSGNDQFVLGRAQAIYKMVTKWIDEADSDFQWKNSHPKKKLRRWD